jgi:hypothetical protein
MSTNAAEPIITVERMAYDKVWEAKDLLIDICADALPHNRQEARRIISAAQWLLTEAKALLS